MMNWTNYPNFSRDEFNCSQTGENCMTDEAMQLFQRVRKIYGRPMIVTSGYRSPRHSMEATKEHPGAHAQGMAADFACSSGAERHALVKAAFEAGAAGVGIARSFVHIDAGHAHAKRPAMWTY